MSTGVTEVNIFKASEAYQKDPSIIKPLFDIAFEAKGAAGVAYYGKQVQDPSIGYTFLDWDSPEDHDAFMNGPNRDRVLSASRASQIGQKTTYHIKFLGSPSLAFACPVMYVIEVSLSPGIDHAAVQAMMAEATSVVAGLADANRTAYGEAMEDPNKYVVLAGFPSGEARDEFFAIHDLVTEGYRQKFRAVAPFDEVYATMESYAK